MELKGAVALVTGANRGIGSEFVRLLRERGVAKVYAAARDVTAIEVVEADGVVPVRLDVTDARQIEAASRLAGDVQILINNAGISQARRC